MKVKMRSTRACYIPSELREVAANTEFNAADEREADRLTRQRRATRVVVEKPKPVAAPADAAPTPRRKVLSLKDPEPVSTDKTLPNALGSYARRDMRAEGE